MIYRMILALVEAFFVYGSPAMNRMFVSVHVINFAVYLFAAYIKLRWSCWFALDFFVVAKSPHSLLLLLLLFLLSSPSLSLFLLLLLFVLQLLETFLRPMETIWQPSFTCIQTV